VTGSFIELQHLRSDLERQFPLIEFRQDVIIPVTVHPLEAESQREFDLYSVVVGAVIGTGVKTAIEHVIAYIKGRVSGAVKERKRRKKGPPRQRARKRAPRSKRKSNTRK
jgi:hypothetical protein